MTKNIYKETLKSLAQTEDTEWEHLTFRDLKVGDHYIVAPEPGDNSGHGGFLRGSYLFKKIAEEKVVGADYVNNCLRIKDRVRSSIGDSALVLKIF